MKVLLFGATGMVGCGVLHECLQDPRVEHVLAPVRRPSGLRDAKLEVALRGYSKPILESVDINRVAPR